MRGKTVTISLFFLSIHVLQFSDCSPVPNHHLSGLQDTSGYQGNHDSNLQARKESTQPINPIETQSNNEIPTIGSQSQQKSTDASSQLNNALAKMQNDQTHEQANLEQPNAQDNHKMGLERRTGTAENVSPTTGQDTLSQHTSQEQASSTTSAQENPSASVQKRNEPGESKNQVNNQPNYNLNDLSHANQGYETSFDDRKVELNNPNQMNRRELEKAAASGANEQNNKSQEQASTSTNNVQDHQSLKNQPSNDNQLKTDTLKDVMQTFHHTHNNFNSRGTDGEIFDKAAHQNIPQIDQKHVRQQI